MTDRDLFANFDRMRREMDELFGGALERSGIRRKRAGFSPPIDVTVTSEPPMAVITVELAGLSRDDIDIQVQGGQVTICGERPAASGDQGVYQQVEIERGRFRRVVSLPAEIDAKRVSASYEAGMLRIELPLLPRRSGVTAVPIESSPPQ